MNAPADIQDRDIVLTPAQERLWFLSQLRPGSPFGNITRAWQLTGPVDASRLNTELHRVIDQNPLLRTVFPSVVGRVQPAIGQTPDDPLIVVDAAEPHEFLARESAHVFDIATGPLLRVSLGRLPGDGHLLVAVAHQLVADAASVDLLLAQLVTGEQDAVAPGGDGPDPQSLEHQTAYWRGHLAGAPAALELPADFARPATAGFEAGWCDVEIPASAVSALTVGTGDAHAVLLGGFMAVLARYTGREDILIGLDEPNRDSVAAAAIGPLANLLIIRAGCSVSETMHELAGRVKETVAEAKRHGDVPFEYLVKELAPARDLSRSPLVQVRVRIGQAAARPQLPGVTAEAVAVAPVATRYDLELEITERHEGSWDARIIYASGLFTPTTVQRLAAAYTSLLTAAAAEPAAPLSALELQSEADRDYLNAWNSTALPVPKKYAHDLIKDRALAQPQAIAAECDGQKLTYAELDGRSDHMAHWLTAQGITPGAVVGVRLPRGLDLVVAFLSVLKAGAAYLPLDPSDPLERLQFVVGDAEAAAVLTAGEQLELPCPVLTPDLTGDASSLAGAALHPESAAYVIYTSGSTGRPKGVCVPHQGLANLVAWHSNQYRLGPDDRCGQLSRTVFDASVWETIPVLAAGATLVIAPPDAGSTADTVIEWVKSQRLTVTFLPIQITERLFRRPGAAELSLRILLTGSDRLMQYPPESLPFKVVNHYGPTETSVIATAGTVPAVFSPRPPSIGSPIANTQVHILDPLMHRVPIGAPGELYIGGQSVGRGYLSRRALTAERFVPDPFSGRAGARLYRTGDLARWLPDGTLEFLGRSDNQVKIRGYRIECGEIESCLLSHPAVEEAVVVAIEDAPGEKRLAGYLVGDPTELNVTALRTYLLRRLPDYMVPAAWVVLPEFPKNTSGKVDRNALPPPLPSRPDLDNPYVAPRTDLERTLAAIFATVLNLESVGVYDNFFELGGHSLLATKIVGGIIEELAPSDIDLRAVFEYPTIAELAASLSPQRSERDQ